MAAMNITIPDTQVVRVLDAFAVTYGFTGKDPRNNAETKAAFAKRMLMAHILAVVKGAEAQVAAQAARDAAITNVDSTILLS